MSTRQISLNELSNLTLLVPKIMSGNYDAIDEEELTLCCAVCCANCSTYPRCDAIGCSGKVRNTGMLC